MKTFADIDGGLPAFEAAYAEGSLLGAVKQSRYGAYLNALGSPGAAAWDPFTGKVELRGHVFRAEQVGSFDGQSWLWSWANEHLSIPDERTTIARHLRDKVDLAAFRAPMIAASDERLPYMFGSLALAHTEVEGYYVANHSQVYVMLPGQVPAPSDDAIDELRAAFDAMKAEPVMPFDAMRALPFAAGKLGLSVEEEGEVLRVVGEDDAIEIDRARAHLGRLAIAFLPQRMNLEQVIALLGDDERVPALEIGSSGAWARGEGWEAHVSVTDKLRPVMREAKGLPARVDEARQKSTVVVIETATEPGFTNGVVPSRSWTGASWVPASMVKDPVGIVAMPALAIAERLNREEGSLLYDVALRMFYPKS